MVKYSACFTVAASRLPVDDKLCMGSLSFLQTRFTVRVPLKVLAIFKTAIYADVNETHKKVGGD